MKCFTTRILLTAACLLVLTTAAQAAEPNMDAIPKADPKTVAALKDLSHEITLGKGKTDVVMVSDPFCVFCRMAYDHLAGEPDSVGKLLMVHVPLAGHPGSDMAGALAGYLATKGKGREAIDLAYHMDEPETNSYSEAGAIVYKEFQKAFPDELKSLSMKQFIKIQFPILFDTSKAVRKLGLKGTPHIMANGRHLNGYKASWLDLILAAGKNG